VNEHSSTAVLLGVTDCPSKNGFFSPLLALVDELLICWGQTDVLNCLSLPSFIYMDLTQTGMMLELV